MSARPRAPQVGVPLHTRWPGARPVVWAPDAGTVDLVSRVDGELRTSPLRLLGAQRPGYWGADQRVPYGTPYGFRVDDGPLVADPAGAWFPDGVHELPRAFDPYFSWTDDGWQAPDLGAGVLLHLDVPHATPEGTLDAAARLLPRVAACGVDGVELAPLSAFDPDAGPEAGVRLSAVHEPYGGPRALQRFVDAAHALGLAVVLTLPHRWAVVEDLGLGAYGRHAVDGRTPREGSGARGLRDLLTTDAQRWFEEFHVDGLQLDVDALEHRTPVTLSELADTAVAASERLQRPTTLFVDGPGRSDRLAGVLRRVLGAPGSPRDPDAVVDVRHLAASLTPAARLPLRAERDSRRSHAATARAASLVVGDLTRLPGARAGMPWAADAAPRVHGPQRPVRESAAAADLDVRSSLLTLAVLVGTAAVLDTDHLPLTAPHRDTSDTGDDGSARLVEWCTRLTALREDAMRDLALEVDVRAAGSALTLRRGRSAVVVATGPDDARVPLEELLPGAPSAWSLVAGWSPRAAVDGAVLTLPARTTAVLRAEA
ncbi:hypothetical protein [Xylanimonas oleitrophica]|uniref:hypothetical protein n=1 Tax=Xylanimonas oleitrophica TaxID=2607479 RepID=UPI0011B4C492|nr:hypothetical protein [Xylanimonas oleitrophica]